MSESIHAPTRQAAEPDSREAAVRGVRYDLAMRFRVRVEVCLEVASLEQAQALTREMESAVFDAVGQAVVPDFDRALSHTELEAIDEAARAALAADDLGPGISSARFEHGSARPDGS